MSGITLKEAYTSSSGAVVCKYTRTVAVPAESMYYFYDITQPHYTMYAFGRSLAANNFPATHEPKPERGHSKDPVVFINQVSLWIIHTILSELTYGHHNIAHFSN